MKQIIKIINKLCNELDRTNQFKKSDKFDNFMYRLSRDYSDSPEFRRIMDYIGSDEDLEDTKLFNAIHGEEMPGYGEEFNDDDPLQVSEIIKNLKLEREAYNTEYKMLLKESNPSTEERRDILWNRVEEIDIELQQLHDRLESKKYN